MGQLPDGWICNYFASIWILHRCMDLTTAELDPHLSRSPVEINCWRV